MQTGWNTAIFFAAGLLPAALLLGPLQSTARGDDAQLAKYAKIYADHLQKLKKDLGTTRERWPRNYVAALRRLKKKSQESGDLERWSVIDAETKRFQQEKTILDASAASGLAVLRQTQERYRQKLADAELAFHRGVVDLTRKYVARLETIQKSFTKDGKIDQALKIREEINRVNTSDDVRSSEFILADIASSTSAPKKEDAPAVSPVFSSPPAGLSEVKDVDGVTVYPLGVRPPASKTMTYKRAKSFKTSKSTLSGGATATIYDGSHKSSKTTGGHRGMYHRSRSRQTLETRFLRVQARSTRSDVTLSNVIVYVQHFAKDKTTGGSSGTPREFSAKYVMLPRLTSRGAYMDFPEISLSSYEHKSSGYSNYRYKSAGGRKYAGCVITIFGADQKLLYQCSTDRAVARYALSHTPDFDTQLKKLRYFETKRALNEASRLIRRDNPESRLEYDEAYRDYQDARQDWSPREGN